MTHFMVQSDDSGHSLKTSSQKSSISSCLNFVFKLEWF